MSDKGRQLDLTSTVESSGGPDSQGDSDGRPFLGIHFACCDVYIRVYANHERTAYVGACPKCAKRVTFQIGSGGTDSRFFTAY